ncbi:MAG TPA: metallophosphoesterase, partial [Stellaceae bacterium]|nr:metallophosphoesterase [Stellaceae bacterium]
QSCNDPEAWPWARLAPLAASLHPDLVIHVGDYLYRETPCPALVEGCAGSPYGDRWETWNADFFAPAAPLLAAAPWIFVRGNHEDCNRAGPGWTRLLSTRPLEQGAPCLTHEPPYRVPLDRLALIVLDNADAQDDPANEALAAEYRADFARVAALGMEPSFLLMHRPLLGVLRLRSGAVVGGNKTMLGANPLLHVSIKLALSGHIHAFEGIDYNERSVPQLIAGTGGDNLDMAPADLSGILVGGIKIKEGLTLSRFGFLTLDREGQSWLGQVYDVTGAVIGRCQLREVKLTCRAAI